MKCEQLLRILGDYIDGEIDPEMCELFERHMAQCPRCQVVVDTMRKTIALYRDGELVFEMPVQFRERLHQAIRQRWQEKFGSSNT
ncbi:MAG: zf-HC2 domain-containing protein [Armatimonadota bacterium]